MCKKGSGRFSTCGHLVHDIWVEICPKCPIDDEGQHPDNCLERGRRDPVTPMPHRCPECVARLRGTFNPINRQHQAVEQKERVEREDEGIRRGQEKSGLPQLQASEQASSSVTGRYGAYSQAQAGPSTAPAQAGSADRGGGGVVQPVSQRQSPPPRALRNQSQGRGARPRDCRSASPATQNAPARQRDEQDIRPAPSRLSEAPEGERNYRDQPPTEAELQPRVSETEHCYVSRLRRMLHYRTRTDRELDPEIEGEIIQRRGDWRVTQGSER